MKNKNKYYKIGGTLLALAGVIGSITIDSKYSIVSLLGVVFLLLAAQNNKR